MAQADGGSGQLENAVTYQPDLSKLKSYFEDARDANDDYRKESLIDRDYFDGYQWTADERKVLEDRKQPPLYFNEVKIAIRGLIGVWEQGETDPRAWPRNPEDEDSADVATKALRFVKDATDWSDLRTYCAKDYFVEGTCAAFVGVDENGRVAISQVRFEEFFHDPRSRSLEFDDARYLGMAKWMFADDIAAMYPDQREDILSSLDTGTTLSVGGDTFADRPDGERSAWVDGKMRRVFVVEMYHREGNTWMRCVFWGRGIFEAGPSPYHDQFGRPTCPIKARSCYIDRDNRRFGEVRDLRSPQDAINKRESKLLHLANNRQVQAVDVDKALHDADLVRLEASRPDGVLPPGWSPVPTQDLAAGQAMLLDSARNFIQRIGQNPGVLASQSASASGRAQIARQQAGMTDTAMTLNGLRRFELTVFKASWERCKQFWRQPDWLRVTDREGSAEFVGINQPVLGQPQVMMGPGGMPQMGQPVLGYQNALAELDVDITIDSVPDTANLAAEQFQTLAELAQAGVPIPPKALLVASSLPNKREILEEMQQPDPAAEMQTQIGMAAAQSDVEKTQSETARNMATAQATLAKIGIDAMSAGHRAGMAQQGAADL